MAALRAETRRGHAERHPEFAAFVDEVVMTEKHAKAFEDARAAAAEEDGVAAATSASEFGAEHTVTTRVMRPRRCAGLPRVKENLTH